MVSVGVRRKGKITDWNTERGFGFVTPAGGGERVYVHVTAISDRRRAPAVGDMVTYDLKFDERKRPRAVGVRRSAPIGSRTEASRPRAPSSLPLIFATLFVLFVIAATLKGALPPAVIVLYGVFSVLTLLSYAQDKSAAQQGRWRTKESTLLLLGLFGGWPGAVLAQKVIRHKSRKTSFQVAFWGTVVLNTAALGWWLLTGGANSL